VKGRAEVVLPGAPLAETVAFFRDRVGMRLCSIRPADAPTVAVLEGGGLRVRLDAAHRGDPGLVRVEAERDEVLVAPNGTQVRRCAPTALMVPEPAGTWTVVDAPAADRDWTEGRAGMLYRDLVPGRLGGHVVASHIRVRDAGAVPDDVHYHDVAAQLIHCVRGRVRLVYEDQGPAFELREGQTLLQPPRIRHRVLSSDGRLEVVEVTSPAEHETLLDPDLSLPTSDLHPGRAFSGQRFVVQQQDDDDAIAGASGGRIAAAVMQLDEAPHPIGAADRVEFVFALRGSGALTVEGASAAIAQHSAATLPPGCAGTLRATDGVLTVLRVRLATD